MPRVQYTVATGNIGFMYQPGDGAKRQGAEEHYIYVDNEGIDLSDDEASQAILHDRIVLVADSVEKLSLPALLEEAGGEVQVELLDGTVAELEAAIPAMSLSGLETVRTAELNGKNRSTAIEALDAAIAALPIEPFVETTTGTTVETDMAGA